jgi:hypothetical protein
MKNSRLPSPPAIGLSNQRSTAARARAGIVQALLDHRIHRLVAHDAALADLAGLQLELRLDQHQQLAVVGQELAPPPAAPASAR